VPGAPEPSEQSHSNDFKPSPPTDEPVNVIVNPSSVAPSTGVMLQDNGVGVGDDDDEPQPVWIRLNATKMVPVVKKSSVFFVINFRRDADTAASLLKLCHVHIFLK
jgi:hypothetical protein